MRQNIISCLLILTSYLTMSAQQYCEDYGLRSHNSFSFNPIMTTPSTNSWQGDGSPRVQKLIIDVGNKFGNNIPSDGAPIPEIYLEEQNFALEFKSTTSFGDKIYWNTIRLVIPTLSYDQELWTIGATSSTYETLLNSSVFPSSFNNDGNTIDATIELISKYEFEGPGEILQIGEVIKRKVDLKITIIPKSDDYYEDDIGNTMTVWKSSVSNGRAIVTSEGVDFSDSRPAQFYWRADGRAMLDCLIDAGFDIYLLDYDRGQEDLRHNAEVFQFAVRDVAQDVGKKVIAAGFSMGGVINRYACAKQEGLGNPLPITHMVCIDAPQQGAEVNVDTQILLRSLEATLGQLNSLPIGQGSEELDGMLKIQYQFFGLKSTTAKQLLNTNIFDSTGGINSTFYNELNSLNGNGYPLNAKTIGISFGNQNTPNPNPTGTIINVNYNFGDLPALFNIPQDFVLSLILSGINATLTSGTWIGTCSIQNDAISSQAGSYFPQLPSLNLSISSPTFNQILQLDMVPSSTSYMTFMPLNSTLDLQVPLDTMSSNFDVPIVSNSMSFHDRIPESVRRPLLMELLIENLKLQNQTIYDQRVYVSNNSIEVGKNVDPNQSIGNYTLSSTSDVIFQAGKKVKLKPGFKTILGAHFYAEIINPEDHLDCGDVIYQGRETVQDFDNKIFLSKRSNKDQAGKLRMKLSPNPVSFENLNVTVSLDYLSAISINLYDLNGTLLEQLKVANESITTDRTFELQTDDLQTGMYLINIQTDRDQLTQKFIKQ